MCAHDIDLIVEFFVLLLIFRFDQIVLIVAVVCVILFSLLPLCGKGYLDVYLDHGLHEGWLGL